LKCDHRPRDRFGLYDIFIAIATYNCVFGKINACACVVVNIRK